MWGPTVISRNWRVGVTFVLSLCHTPECHYLLWEIMSGAHLFVATALDHLTPMASRAYVPQPRRLNKQRQFLVGYHPWGTCAEKRLKCTPILSVKRSLCACMEPQPEGRLLVWHISRGLVRCSTWTEAGGCHFCTPPQSHSRLLISLRKVLARMLKPWFLWVPPRGYLRINRLRQPVGLMLAVLEDCIYRGGQK